MIVEVHGMGFWTRVRFPPAPLDREKVNIFAVCYDWKHSSAGRALRSQRKGRGFESRCLHLTSENSVNFLLQSFFRSAIIPFVRKHSSAGMSVRLTRERSWVRAPLLPLIKTLKTQALPGFQGFSFSVSVSESSISVLISAISEWKYSFRFLMIYEVNNPLDFRPSAPGKHGHSGWRC